MNWFSTTVECDFTTGLYGTRLYIIDNYSDDNMTYKNITCNLTALASNTNYKIIGINSCVGLVIKLGRPNAWGGLDFVSGKAIHFVDGTTR